MSLTYCYQLKAIGIELKIFTLSSVIGNSLFDIENFIRCVVLQSLFIR
jgi:hypothetical protein